MSLAQFILACFALVLLILERRAPTKIVVLIVFLWIFFQLVAHVGLFAGVIFAFCAVVLTIKGKAL